MKINNIYIGVYILLTLIFVPLWFILKPDIEAVTYEQITNEVTYVEIGDEIPIDHHALKKTYDYDAVSLMNIMRNNQYEFTYLSEQNEPMFFENHRSEFIASRHGLAIYVALLYRNDRLAHIVNLGYHLQYEPFDADDETWIGLNQSNFMSALEQNPSGKFYLSENINLNTRNRLIEIFSGILYNPYKFVITNVNGIENEDDQGLFRVLDNAIIDGIMIRNSRIDGTDDSGPMMSSTVGFLSSAAFGSFISNVSVEGDISFDYALYSGGLIGNSVYSIYRYVSFSGSIKNSSYTGGIIGSNIGYFENVKSLSQMILTKVNTIENSYVDADLSESYSIGGFIGYHYYHTELNFKSVYATGSIDRSQSIDYIRNIGYLATSVLMDGDFNYEYAYTTYPIFLDLEIDADDFDQMTFLTVEEMYWDTPLIGLENFIFSTNDIPRLPYWRIGS